MGKKHVLVTGGAGFIGSHLCDSLLAKGYAVTALDNFVTGSKENLNDAKTKEDFQFIEWDISQPIGEEKMPLIEKYGLAGVLHFACPASPIDFEKIPFEILAVDSLGTMHTVDLCMKYNARYLLASTSEIYGDPLEHPQKESYFGNVNTTGPRACYDETKRFAEAYVTSAVRGSGTYRGKPYTALNAGIVRIFNTYGPRMRPDDGRVVPQFCMQALKGEDLSVCGDGKQTRSFCYVSDLIDGIVRLFESDCTDPVNIGNPTEHTILEFADEICKITGSGSKPTFLPARQDDPKRRCPDISRAKSVLKWEPQVNLNRGLAETVEFFKQKL